MESKGSDDTLGMYRMIWICAVCACLIALFGLMWSIWKLKVHEELLLYDPSIGNGVHNVSSFMFYIRTHII